MFPDGELSVDMLLRNVEVLDVEEAIFTNGLDQSLCKLLPAFWSTVEAKVDRDQICPVEILLSYLERMG